MGRDRWLIQHFYGTDAAEMTWPEFMAALDGIAFVTNEMRPKTPQEVAVQMGHEVTEAYKRNRRLRQQQAEDN